jgi:hypothetical protein
MMAFKLRCTQPVVGGLYTYQQEEWTGSGGQLGWNMAMDYLGNTLVVGSRVGNVAAMYERSGSTWGESVVLTNTQFDVEGIYSNQFGRSVDITNDGELIFVGMPEYGPESDPYGAVISYAKDGITGWTLANEAGNYGEKWDYTNSMWFGSAEQGLVGYSLSCSSDGTYVFVGAPSHIDIGDDTTSFAGAVLHLYGTDINLGGSEVGYLNNETPNALKRFGDNVTCSKGIFPGTEWPIVLVTEADDFGGLGEGRVLVFIYGEGYYYQVLTQPVYNDYNYFGWRTCITANGTRFAVGCPGAEDSRLEGANPRQGKVYVYSFVYDGNTEVITLIQTIASPVVQQYAWFGTNVAMSHNGSILAIAAGDEDVNGVVDCGAVYIYQWSGSEYTLAQKIVAPNAAAYDYFGYGLALSGDGTQLAISGLWADRDEVANTGSVYFYSLT